MKFNGVSYIIQRGAEAALSDECKPLLRTNIDYYMENAAIIADVLRRHGIYFSGGRNSPYLWLWCGNSRRFFEALLHAGVVGTPGIGFGMGIERMLMVQELRGVSPKAPDLYDAFVVTMGDGARIEGIKLVEELRAAGLKSDLDHAARSMKAQFKYANKVGVKKVVVIAGDELEKGVVKLRDMENSTEEEVARGEIVARLLGEKK